MKEGCQFWQPSFLSLLHHLEKIKQKKDCHQMETVFQFYLFNFIPSLQTP
ncbi:hypothetical protein SAMN05216474_1197 [Lishizhenia tianjinensis]|uniref:Uncharacterized protein n=1 Tax=Lishizhenia tianjinensis TaxID=477690 RepID=A0A1I6YUP1_9FLAO|nr:hypothetical protein SAMN05216474_1197 [Lishizhenia tianjinensis]